MLAEVRSGLLKGWGWLNQRRSWSPWFRSQEQSILFTDLTGCCQWALAAGNDEVADLLRAADAVITEAVETNEASMAPARAGHGPVS